MNVLSNDWIYTQQCDFTKQRTERKAWLTLDRPSVSTIVVSQRYSFPSGKTKETYIRDHTHQFFSRVKTCGGNWLIWTCIPFGPMAHVKSPVYAHDIFFINYDVHLMTSQSARNEFKRLVLYEGETLCVVNVLIYLHWALEKDSL